MVEIEHIHETRYLYRKLENFLLILLIPLVSSYGLLVWHLPSWDTSARKLFQEGFSDYHFSPDGQWIFAQGGTQIAVFSRQSGALQERFTQGPKSIHPISKNSHFVRAFCFSADGRQLIVGEWPGRIIVWDLIDRCVAFELEVNEPILCAEVSRDGQWLALGTAQENSPSTYSHAKVYRMSDHQLHASFELKKNDEPYELSFSQDNHLLAVTYRRNSGLDFLDIDRKEIVKVAEDFERHNKICFYDDGRKFLATQPALSIWDVQTLALLNSLDIYCEAVHLDSAKVVSLVSYRGKVTQLDLEIGKRLPGEVQLHFERWPWLIFLGYLIAWGLWLAQLVQVNKRMSALAGVPVSGPGHLILAVGIFLGCSLLDIIPYDGLAPGQVLFCLMVTFLGALAWLVSIFVAINRSQGRLPFDGRYLLLTILIWFTSLAAHLWLTNIAIGIIAG